jgi:hypothetical protein
LGGAHLPPPRLNIQFTGKGVIKNPDIALYQIKKWLRHFLI